jgi:hypothetical protein
LVAVVQALPPVETVTDPLDLLVILQFFLQSLQRVVVVVVVIGVASVWLVSPGLLAAAVVSVLVQVPQEAVELQVRDLLAARVVLTIAVQMT